MITTLRTESCPKKLTTLFLYVPTSLQTFNCSDAQKIVTKWGWGEAQKRS